ncbi:MAG: hypothetical protein H6Q52_2794 [Deltaproteobacteria bacterium]|nr:hypothetical protein [Deltaproteobacteria bacterium]
MIRHLVSGLKHSPRVWKMLKLSAVCAAICLFWGCIQDNTVINVKPDGGGTIEETVLMGNSFIDMMQGLTKSMSEAGEQDAAASKEKPKSDDSVITEMMEKAKTNAKEFGAGVKFVSAKPAKTETASGYTATYSFDDISKVTLNQNPGKKTPGESKKENADAEAAKNDTIKFAFKKGPVARLSVTMPPPKTDDKKDESVQKDQTDDPRTIEMLKSMFKDMKVSIVLNMVGDIVSTNATYRTDKKITLIDMDFGKLVNDMALLKKINQAQPQSVEEVKAMVKGMEGLKLEFVSPVTVDFK